MWCSNRDNGLIPFLKILSQRGECAPHLQKQFDKFVSSHIHPAENKSTAVQWETEIANAILAQHKSIKSTLTA
jgi:hypothetical protein